MSAHASAFREEAEAHWVYTEGIIRRSIEAGDDEGACVILEKFIDLCRYLYVEGMIHGYGHGKEDTK